MLPAIGQRIKIGLSSPSGDGINTVLGIYRYTGRYDFFTHVIRYTSDTRRGWTEQTIHENEFGKTGELWYNEV